MGELTKREWILAAYTHNDTALRRAIRLMFGCHEVDVDDAGDVYIRGQGFGIWLDPDQLARVVRAIQAGEV